MKYKFYNIRICYVVKKPIILAGDSQKTFH